MYHGINTGTECTTAGPRQIQEQVYGQLQGRFEDKEHSEKQLIESRGVQEHDQVHEWGHVLISI